MSDEASSTAPGPGVRRPGRFRVALALLLVLLLGLVVVRFLRHDVVTSWKLLATCPSTADALRDAGVEHADTVACTTPPTGSLPGRGWPIVAFALPADVGLDPSINAVHSDRPGGVMWVDYDAAPPGDGKGRGDTVLAFIEVPPAALPDVPFTVRGAAGPVTVSTVPAG